MIQWVECYEEMSINRKEWQVQKFGQKKHNESNH